MILKTRRKNRSWRRRIFSFLMSFWFGFLLSSLFAQAVWTHRSQNKLKNDDVGGTFSLQTYRSFASSRSSDCLDETRRHASTSSDQRGAHWTSTSERRERWWFSSEKKVYFHSCCRRKRNLSPTAHGHSLWSIRLGRNLVAATRKVLCDSPTWLLWTCLNQVLCFHWPKIFNQVPILYTKVESLGIPPSNERSWYRSLSPSALSTRSTWTLPWHGLSKVSQATSNQGFRWQESRIFLFTASQETQSSRSTVDVRRNALHTSGSVRQFHLNEYRL